MDDLLQDLLLVQWVLCARNRYPSLSPPSQEKGDHLTRWSVLHVETSATAATIFVIRPSDGSFHGSNVRTACQLLGTLPRIAGQSRQQDYRRRFRMSHTEVKETMNTIPVVRACSYKNTHPIA